MSQNKLNWGAAAADVVGGIGDALSTLFGGNSSSTSETSGSSSMVTGTDSGLPVSVGVNTDTKKLFVYGGIIAISIFIVSFFIKFKGGRR